MSAQGEPREPVWTETELAYLREHYRYGSGKEVATALGRPYLAVRAKAQKIGLKTRPSGRSWTEEDSAYLAEHYEISTTLEIAKALGRGHAIIKVQADKMGLLSPKRRAAAAVQHDYFAEIDNPIKAYILGLLASDGWVADARNEVGIDLHPKDESVIQVVRAEVAPLACVLHRSKGDRVGLRIYSGQMKSDLIALGVTPRKSQTLRWPTALPRHLDNSFILGCFDGDGSLGYEAKRRYYRWSLVSASVPFLLEVQARAMAHIGFKIRGPYQLANGNRAFQLQYVGPKTYLLDGWLHAEIGGLARKRIPVTQAR